jgi:bacterioferritin (cytochrome b1)
MERQTPHRRPAPPKDPSMPSRRVSLDDANIALDALNRLMRSELAAVESYRQAIAILGERHRDELIACLQSHDQRATALAEFIVLAGGTPVSGSGPWEGLAKAVDGGPGRPGDLILAALEQDEAHALLDYRTASDLLDEQGAALLRRQLLPEQIRTHGLMTACRRRGAKPGDGQ